MINTDNILLEENQKLVNKVQENTERTMNETMPVILEQAMNELTEDEVRELKEGLSNILSRAEYIFSEDGFLPRHGYYLESSTSFDFLSFENIFVLFRLGELKIDPMRQTDSFLNPYRNNYNKSLLENNDEDNERFYPLLKDPQTWNRKMITFALGYDITSYAKLKLEYYILDEETGDIDQPDVKDDQLLVQLKFNF